VTNYQLASVISIHAPRGGSDGLCLSPNKEPSNFNPRSPWGERPFHSSNSFNASYFNPRSPWGERRRHLFAPVSPSQFQSTLPVGGATLLRVFTSSSMYFNPRSPWGERLVPLVLDGFAIDISIHAPRGGSDDLQRGQHRQHRRISIHAPRGGSDYLDRVPQRAQGISIHAPRGGSDVFYAQLA